VLDKILHFIFPLPVLASEQGQQVDLLLYLLHGLMLVLFIGWAIFFIVVILRFRAKKSPKADYEGARSKVSTYVELAVAAAEMLLLIVIAIPFWSSYVRQIPVGKDVVEVRVIAEQFAWHIHYPGPDRKFSRTDMRYFDAQANPLALDPSDPNGKDDIFSINQMHVPVDQPVVIHLSSKDVIHSFSVPAMRVKQDAQPGMVVPFWFTPNKTGKYDIVCAQLCGIGHYRMRGFLTVESKEDFAKWQQELTP
jgi:cytochrome c oxidase subunit 2